eukprot:scaffold85992_cov63-Phaeocystis_antarctica.AAC.2
MAGVCACSSGFKEKMTCALVSRRCLDGGMLKSVSSSSDRAHIRAQNALAGLASLSESASRVSASEALLSTKRWWLLELSQTRRKRPWRLQRPHGTDGSPSEVTEDLSVPLAGAGVAQQPDEVVALLWLVGVDDELLQVWGDLEEEEHGGLGQLVRGQAEPEALRALEALQLPLEERLGLGRIGLGLR